MSIFRHGRCIVLLPDLQLIDCTLNAAKQNEELQDRPPQLQDEAYLGLPIDQ